MDDESTRIFHTRGAAEDVYRLLQQNFDTIVTKIDSLTETVETLTTAIIALVTQLAEQIKRIVSPSPSRHASESINNRHDFLDRDRSLEPVITRT